MNFGQYAILEPLEYFFKKEPEWTWLVKAPTSGDELLISRFLNQGKVTAGLNGVSREAPKTWLEIAYREIALTFAGTSIPVSDEDPTPILKTTASVMEVEKMLTNFPQAMVQEIWEAVRDHVPGWGPKAVTEEETEDGTTKAP
jgi:hypothetical protein